MENKSEVLQYLNSLMNRESFRKFTYHERKLNSNSLSQFAEIIGFNENNHKIIHIAGTNGKGSIAYLLSFILNQLQYNSITYLSPHLVEINERILLNQKPIDDNLFVKLSNTVRSIFEKLSIQPSYFEFLNAMAVNLAHEYKIEYLILETGLGGRLDSTNFVKNKLAIISSISYDHTHILGNSLLEIAQEKAGIIHNDNEVILSKQEKSLYNFFNQYCNDKSARLFAYNEDFFVKNIKTKGLGYHYSYQSFKYSLDIQTPFKNSIQCLNLSVVLFALERLNIKLNLEKFQQQLLLLSLPGRMQFINSNPDILIDGAHNPQAIRNLSINLKKNLKNYNRRILIFGMNEDKDYEKSLDDLFFFDEIIISSLSFIIKNDIGQEIYNYCKEYKKNCYYCDDFSIALDRAKDRADNNTLIVITGSFYLCGEAKKLLLNP